MSLQALGPGGLESQEGTGSGPREGEKNIFGVDVGIVVPDTLALAPRACKNPWLPRRPALTSEQGNILDKL